MKQINFNKKKLRKFRFKIFAITTELHWNVKNLKFLFYYFFVVAKIDFFPITGWFYLVLLYVWVQYELIGTNKIPKIYFFSSSYCSSHWFTKVRRNAQNFTLKQFFFNECLIYILIQRVFFLWAPPPKFD